MIVQCGVQMGVAECDYLDEYLSAALSDQAAARFEAHLADCPACREELERQRQVDWLLVHAVRRLDAVPAGLLERIERQAQPSLRRRTVRVAVSILAAAALVLGVLFSAGQFGADHQRGPMLQDRGERVADRKPALPRPGPTPAVRPDVRVTVDDPSSAILVSKATKTANVSIVMIYPTVKPARATNGPLAE
jgi:anti-sigma factor RsiW